MISFVVILVLSLAMFVIWTAAKVVERRQFTWHPHGLSSVTFPDKDMRFALTLDLAAAAMLAAAFLLHFRWICVLGLLLAGLADLMSSYDFGSRMGYRLGGVVIEGWTTPASALAFPSSWSRPTGATLCNKWS